MIVLLLQAAAFEDLAQDEASVRAFAKKHVKAGELRVFVGGDKVLIAAGEGLSVVVLVPPKGKTTWVVPGDGGRSMGVYGGSMAQSGGPGGETATLEHGGRTAHLLAAQKGDEATLPERAACSEVSGGVADLAIALGKTADEKERTKLVEDFIAGQRPLTCSFVAFDLEAKWLVALGADGTDAHPDGVSVHVPVCDIVAIASAGGGRKNGKATIEAEGWAFDGKKR